MSDLSPKAIIFDLLTALLDSWTVWDQSVPPGSMADGQTWRKRYLELTYQCGEYIPYESLVQQSAQEVGLSPEAATALCKNWDMIKPWKEVPGVLAALKKSGYKLAVVTNCSVDLGMRAAQNCSEVVRAAKQENFDFDVVVTAEQSGFYKPRPEPYLEVLRELNVEAKDAVFVAGSAADIPGASGVGMTVCWHNRVGLDRKDNIMPWREGETLTEVLEPLLNGNKILALSVEDTK